MITNPEIPKELGIWNCGQEICWVGGDNKNNTSVFKQLNREEIVHARELLKDIRPYMFGLQCCQLIFLIGKILSVMLAGCSRPGETLEIMMYIMIH